MKFTLKEIKEKPNDFKICTACDNINWRESDFCSACGADEFVCGKSIIKEWTDKEISFWSRYEHVTADEASQQQITVK